MPPSSSSPSPQFLARPEGRIAYQIEGTGPVVICVPGMGDLRSSYRFLVPHLVAAGFRVATMDLRGHGDSDTTFTAYDDDALATDIVALIEKLGGPAIVVGNSMGAGAAVIAAADRPELFSGIALLGPFVRNPPMNPFMSLLFRAATAPAWARFTWKAFLPSLYAGHKPDDLPAYLVSVADAMKLPGHTAAFSKTTRTTHEPAEMAARSGRVTVPVLVVMGDSDPDFKDQRGEAGWIARTLDGEIVIVEDCGHYPQSQRPDITGPAVVAFARRTSSDA